MYTHIPLSVSLPLSSVGSNNSPIAFLGLIIPVVVIAILLKVFFPTIKSALHSRQLLKTGKTAQAQILSVRQTGVYVNNQPQFLMTLQVQPEFGASFQAEARKVVSLAQIPSFQPGGMVEVKYDPADQKEVAISALLTGVGAGGMFAGAPAMGSGFPTGSPAPSMNPAAVEQMLRQYQAAQMQIIQAGIQTHAKVLQFMPMNINVNGNNPVVNLMVEVQPVDGSPFDAQIAGVLIGEAAIPKFQPGQTITVRYMGDDHTKVAVEHSGE